MTLIELLITMAIIATLSAAFLGVSSSAMEAARVARTKMTIAKIHGLLMERWASYATRRADIRSDIQNQINTAAVSATQRGQMRADARLLATRELMKLEMPDRWSDVLLNGIPDDTVSTMPFNEPLILTTRPSLSNSYKRRFFKAANVKDNGETLRRNQGAECLYMIIMLSTGDGEARTQFSQKDIGDTDEDGAPEFLDGWGNPIRFVRWPAGFWANSVLISGNADADHDPFDHFRRDSPEAPTPSVSSYPTRMTESPPAPLTRGPIQSIRYRNGLTPPNSAFRLVPLVYSNGPDGIADLMLDTGKVTQIDPYAHIYDALSQGITNEQLATPVDFDDDGDNWIDNIHNHLQDGR